MENTDQQVKKLSMADRFLIAMFSPKEYVKILRETSGKTVGFVVLLILLVTLARYVVPMVAIIAGMGGMKGIIMDEIPEFSLENGKFYIEERIEKKDELSGIYVLIDSDENKFTEDDIPSGYVEAVLVSENNMLVYNEFSTYSGKSQNVKFSELKGETISNQTILDNVFYIYMTLFTVFLFMYIMEYFKYMFMALCFSLFMFLYGNAINHPHPFNLIYKVAIFALSIGTLVYSVTCGFGNSIFIFAGNIFQILITFSIMRKVLFPIQIRPMNRE